jgi:uncharacterized RDD family membrane protein YckC
VVPEGTILGLDNVFLTLPIAGVGSRVLAAFIDGFIQIAIQIIWLIVWVVAVRTAAPGPWMIALYVFGAFVIDSAYFAGSEIAMRGRTLGKKAIKLRVVTRAGGTAGAGALLTRNLVRIVDVLVGVPLMALDPLARRLGDRLAGTIVVHDRAAQPETFLRRIPAGWQGEDVALVEALIRRASSLEPDRAEAMARTILARLEREQPDFLVGVWRDGGAVAAVRHAFGAEVV